jgi:hypothetical protein
VPVCARAARGHAAAPPNKLMSSRRLIPPPQLKTGVRVGSN